MEVKASGLSKLVLNTKIAQEYTTKRPLAKLRDESSLVSNIKSFLAPH